MIYLLKLLKQKVSSYNINFVIISLLESRDEIIFKTQLILYRAKISLLIQISFQFLPYYLLDDIKSNVVFDFYVLYDFHFPSSHKCLLEFLIFRTRKFFHVLW